MAPIDRIPPVHIGADQEALALVPSEDIGLVRGGVRPQDRLLVHVIGVCFAAARMIGGKAEGVEVLVRGHDGEECVVVFICRGRETRFDY